MPSREFMIEVFIDDDGYWSYGCPDYDLWGYDNIQKLEEDIVFERSRITQKTENSEEKR